LPICRPDDLLVWLLATTAICHDRPIVPTLQRKGEG
jgi:hypothetical protein